MTSAAELAGIHDGMEKAAFFMIGGGGAALGHKKVPGHLNVGYSNLFGVLPVPVAGARVGSERLGVRAGIGADPTKGDLPGEGGLYYIGIDRGVPRGTHAYYTPGIPGRIIGVKSRTWKPKGKPKGKKK